MAAKCAAALRWSYLHWVLDMVSAAVIGLCAFLAYYFGLTQLAHLPTYGAGLAFLLGVVGGFGGPPVLAVISRKIFYYNVVLGNKKEGPCRCSLENGSAGISNSFQRLVHDRKLARNGVMGSVPTRARSWRKIASLT